MNLWQSNLMFFTESNIQWGNLKNQIFEIARIKLFVLSGNAITLQNLFVALLILIFGIIISKILTEWIRRKALSKTRLDEGGLHAVSRIIYYIFVVTVFVFAMKTAGISFTVFTFLGGALAIAIGFGAQNLLNNFISGLIIMMERPVKIGDLVELESRIGQISHIGNRCTRISLFAGNDMLIPNSFLLEKNVINWTLHNRNVRSVLEVGVIYGSPTRKVEELLIQCVKEHKRALREPAPFVLFTEFGNNSLNFEVYYWVRIADLMDRRIIESDIRYRIDELFRENGIVIAFPQRDVHLDSLKPLEIKLLNSKG